MPDTQLNNKIAELIKDSFGFLFRKMLLFVMVTCGSCILSGVVFYFTTTETLSRHTTDIEDLKHSKVGNETVQSIQVDIKDIKEKQEKMFNYLLENKNDRSK